MGQMGNGVPAGQMGSGAPAGQMGSGAPVAGPIVDFATPRRFLTGVDFLW
jgi:hypothetical protein